MVNRNNRFNFRFDIDKLLLIGAFFTLANDLVKLLITYQIYCDNNNKKNNQGLGELIEEEIIEDADSI
ncbi:MAG: hypothetical protein GX022_07760 [Clostridiaceae bacterium]|nr:hypothetical protein [Clostridiaceae bacterium]